MFNYLIKMTLSLQYKEFIEYGKYVYSQSGTNKCLKCNGNIITAGILFNNRFICLQCADLIANLMSYEYNIDNTLFKLHYNLIDIDREQILFDIVKYGNFINSISKRSLYVCNKCNCQIFSFVTYKTYVLCLSCCDLIIKSIKNVKNDDEETSKGIATISLDAD